MLPGARRHHFIQQPEVVVVELDRAVLLSPIHQPCFSRLPELPGHAINGGPRNLKRLGRLGRRPCLGQIEDDQIPSPQGRVSMFPNSPP
jgi:hypothetical protein